MCRPRETDRPAPTAAEDELRSPRQASVLERCGVWTTAAEGNPMMQRSVAAVGDVTNPSSWSGIPYHFWRAAMKAGFATLPWQMNLETFKRRRVAWNVKQGMMGRGVGGYQYSDDFLERLEAQSPGPLFAP